MASTAQSAHLPALGEHQRKDVGNTLQAMLVELIDLALFGKQLHWNVPGRCSGRCTSSSTSSSTPGVSSRTSSPSARSRSATRPTARPAVAAGTELKPIAAGPARGPRRRYAS